MVLDESSHWGSVGGHNVLVRVVHDLLALGLGKQRHGQVAVHLVAVEVRVVTVAVGVVHADGLLGRRQVLKHPHSVRHHGGLVQRRLPVHDHHVPVHEVPPHRLPLPRDQAFGDGLSTARIHSLQIHHDPVGVPHPVCSRVGVRAPLHQHPHRCHVVHRHVLRPRQGLCKAQRQPDLRGPHVQVGADHGAARVIHTLPHHVHAKQPLFPLQKLPDSVGGGVLSVHAPTGSFRRVHEPIHENLQVDPRADEQAKAIGGAPTRS
mmetsp:Transcript_27193/g.55660  ORF Transcript_27193/g.55660 Transcript_27193/m.55660 type:complete len:262 (-) Transcript_27193:68-853(-)